MKKLLLSVCTVVFLLGCKNNESYLPPEKDQLNKSENISSGLDLIYSNAMEFTKKQPVLFKLGKIEETEIFTFNSKKALQGVSEHLNSGMFENKISNLAVSAAFITSFDNKSSARITSVESVTNLFDTASIYSDNEKELLISLTNNLLNSQNPEIEATEIISSFNEDIYSSTTLSEEEKVVLLNYSAMYKSFFKFIQDGGVDDVYMSMASSLPSIQLRSNARVMGCKVNTRGVLIGAVYSGVKGAIAGALYGGAGGTVTLPGIGTVTGAIGGGVFGAASGFTWGIVDGVATQLLETCFRYIISQDVMCKRIYENIANGAVLNANQFNQYRECFQIDKDDFYLILN